MFQITLPKQIKIGLIFFLLSYINFAEAGEGTIINFAVSERDFVYEDTIKANLMVAEDNIDSKELQKLINQRMEKAVELAKKFEQVEVSTESYRVYQNSLPEKKEGVKQEKATWHGSQQIVLKSKSEEELLNLSGQLQEQGLLMQDLGFTLSSDLHEKTKEKLLSQTIAKLKEKAKLITKLLEKEKSQIVELNIDNSNMAQPLPMMNKAMLLGSAPVTQTVTPIVEPSKVEVKLNITAKVLVE